MPATPYAKITISIEEGPPQTGGVLAAAGQTVQLNSESVLDWPSNPPPRWEIFAYPEGWSGPAGWTVEPKPMPSGAVFNVFVFLGVGPPPAFVLPGPALWGDFLFRLLLANGLLNGALAPQLQDETAGVRVLSPSGLVDTAPRTGTQFDPARSWPGAMQANWRTLDTLIGGLSAPVGSVLVPTVVDAGTSGAAGVSSAMAREDHKHAISTGPPVAVGTANAAGGSSGLARADHVHALQFATVKAVLALANEDLSFNEQILRRMASIEFGEANAVPTIAQEPTTANGATAPTLRVSGANATGTSSIGGDTRVGGSTGTDRDGNVGLGGDPVAGGGGRVVYIANATAVPTSNPSGGSVLWSENSIEFRTPAGVLSTGAPELVSGPQPAHIRRGHETVTVVQTTDATSTTAASYEMPTSSIAKFRAEVLAIGPSGSAGASYTIERTFRRESGGNAVGVGSAPPVGVEEDLVDWNATLVPSGPNVTVVVTGSALPIHWAVVLEASLLYAP